MTFFAPKLKLVLVTTTNSRIISIAALLTGAYHAVYGAAQRQDNKKKPHVDAPLVFEWHPINRFTLSVSNVFNNVHLHRSSAAYYESQKHLNQAPSYTRSYEQTFTNRILALRDKNRR